MCYIKKILFFHQAESAALTLGATSKTVGAAMAQLLTAAAQVMIVSIYSLQSRENLVLVLTQKSKIRLQNVVEKRRNCS